MRFNKNLYTSEGIDVERVKAKIGRNALQFSVYLLVLPRGEKNQLEIIDSKYLLQKNYPKEDLTVVGIAGSYANALELVEIISRKVYDSTGDLNIREYIQNREQEE